MSMYRQYEDPWELEDKLKAKQEEFKQAQDEGADFEELESLHLEINELKERVNFAWQDQEYESEGN